MIVNKNAAKETLFLMFLFNYFVQTLPKCATGIIYMFNFQCGNYAAK